MTNPRRTEGCERHDNEGEIVYSDCWTCCVWRNGNVWTSVWNCWYITWVHLAQMKNIDTMHDCCLLRAFVITLTENFSFLSSKETVCPCQLFFSLLFFDVSNAEMKSSPRVVPIAISSLSLTPLYNSDYIKELYKKKKYRKWSDIFNSLSCFLRHLLKGGLSFNHSQRFPNMDDILSSIHTIRAESNQEN